MSASPDQPFQELADHLLRAGQPSGTGPESEDSASSSRLGRNERLAGHLSRIADRDGSGEVSLDEAEWLSSTISGTMMAAVAAVEVGDDPKVLSQEIGLREGELAQILDDFHEIEGRLRLQCDGHVPVSPRRLQLNSIGEFPEHWQHRLMQGIDTTVGCFFSEHSDLEIAYDIGIASGELSWSLS